MFDYLQPRNGPVVDGLEAQEVVYAKRSLEYAPLRTLVSSGRMGGVISRWTLTPQQRQAVAEGADIYLELSTFHEQLQPIRIAVSDGKLDPSWVKVCLLEQRLTPDEMEKLEIVVPGEKEASASGNFAERLEKYKSDLQAGKTSLDEIRAAEGLPPISGIIDARDARDRAVVASELAVALADAVKRREGQASQ